MLAAYEEEKEQKAFSPTPKGAAITWLENYWYHYKWHTLIALFLVFTVLVCSVQTCSKKSYDVFVMYAGAHDVERQSSSVSEFESVLHHFGAVCEDYDGDGEVRPSFLPLFLPSNEEIEELNKTEGVEVNTSVVADNAEIFRTNIVYSDYYVCLLSPHVYETYRIISDVEVFTPLESYVGSAEVEYYSEKAVYLSSTAFGALPGFSAFPEDTLICLRNLSELSATKSANLEKYERAEALLRSMLAYRP